MTKQPIENNHSLSTQSAPPSPSPRSRMYRKISVILHTRDLYDEQKNFKRVYKKLGQRGFFLKCV